MNNKNITLLVIVMIVAIGYLYFMSNEAAAPTTTDQTEETAQADYIGLTTTEATAKAELDETMFRVVEVDGEPQPTTKDFRPGRINAAVANDVVVSYEVEGSNPPMDEPPATPSELVPTNNDLIIGMTTAEAEAYAQDNDVMFRIGAIDGEFLPVTMDYRVGRITASITDGIVTDYSVEGSLE